MKKNGNGNGKNKGNAKQKISTNLDIAAIE